MLIGDMEKVETIQELQMALQACLEQSDETGTTMVSIYIAHALENLNAVANNDEVQNLELY